MIATAPLAPDRTALLLIDAQQEHFIPGGPHEVPDARGRPRRRRGPARPGTPGRRPRRARPPRRRAPASSRTSAAGGPGFAIRPEVAPAPASR